VGYDVEYKLAQSVTYKSDETSTDREYIGPLYGDHYVGERWYLKWEMFVDTVELNDGDHVYVIRKIKYGIVRAEKKMGIHDKHRDFPSEWKEENPVYNKYPPDEVEWISHEIMDFGHGSYDLNETVSVTNAIFSSITISLNSEMKVWHEKGIELPILKGKVKNTSTFSFEMSTKAKIETENEQQKSIFCHIDDDEPEDIIKMMVGIDKKYGTYIFKTDETSETSAPHEHGTMGNDPPEIALTAPLPDSCYDNTVTIEWEAWDFEGDQLSFNIYYMPNDETLWRLVKADLFENSYEWDVGEIMADSVLIKIEAYDEEYTSIASLANPIYINYANGDCPRNPIYINYPVENAWAGFDMIFD
jgi:hypothetical protein